MKLLGICGSLRESSSNRLLLRAAQKVLSHHEWVEIDLSEFPYFDPVHQFSDLTPEVVTRARQIASESDLIFISTPEYAHGMPGVLKNGLEWLFHEGTQKKRVAIVIGATQGEFTRTELIEVLQTMDFVVGIENTLIINGARAKLEGDATFKHKVDEAEFAEFCRQFA